MASQNSLTDKQTRLLMLEAIKYNNIAKVQQLLNEGINLNRCIKYKDGDWLRSYTPLCIAIAHGSIQLVQLFITSGANVNKSVTCHKPDHQEKFTPLFLACREGQLQIIDLLIQAGALVNVPLSGPRIQEEEGGSIDYNSDVRNNCLHWATMYRKYEQLEKLLQGGGNPRLLNSIQETPLHMACDTYNPPIIRLLARTGGVAAHKDMHGSTPLFKLMFHRGDPSEQIELVKLLLAGGYVLSEETWLNQVRNYLYDTSASNEESNQNPAQIGGQLMATHSRESVEILKSRYGVVFLQWLLDWGTNPHRLKYLCRQAIRDTVGSVRLLQKVRQLPLPLSLINYLQLDQM